MPLNQVFFMFEQGKLEFMAVKLSQSYTVARQKSVPQLKKVRFVLVLKRM
jgi:hypothetical protein